MQTPTESAATWTDAAGTPGATIPIELELVVTDPDVCAELGTFADVRPRNEFALDALKVGVVALRQARGRVEADRLKSEGEHLLHSLRASLEGYQRQVALELSTGLKEYFDPSSGRLAERIERLVKRDGELEQVLRRHVGADGSELTRTLAAHLGEDSLLANLLDSSSSDGFLVTFSRKLDDELSAQRERIHRRVLAGQPRRGFVPSRRRVVRTARGTRTRA